MWRITTKLDHFQQLAILEVEVSDLATFEFVFYRYRLDCYGEIGDGECVEWRCHLERVYVSKKLEIGFKEWGGKVLWKVVNRCLSFVVVEEEEEEEVGVGDGGVFPFSLFFFPPGSPFSFHGNLRFLK